MTTRFSGTPADGHGQHQASAVLGKEAFDAAADPARFPEQLQYVKPWRAARLMRSDFRPLNGRGGPGRGAAANPGPGGRVASAPTPGATERNTAPARKNEPILEIPAGDFDPVTGYSYRGVATLSRNEHKSQAMVSTLVYGQATFGLALNSCTSAIHLALLGLGIKAGDRVGVPGLVCPAVLMHGHEFSARGELAQSARQLSIDSIRNGGEVDRHAVPLDDRQQA